MDVRGEKAGLGFSTNFIQPEQTKPNILMKQSKIRFNFGSKINVPIKPNRIHFTEGNIVLVNIFIFWYLWVIMTTYNFLVIINGLLRLPTRLYCGYYTITKLMLYYTIILA